MQVTPGDLKNTLELCFKQDKTYAVVAWPLFENPSSITSDYLYVFLASHAFDVWSKIFSCFYAPFIKIPFFLNGFLSIQEQG